MRKQVIQNLAIVMTMVLGSGLAAASQTIPFVQALDNAAVSVDRLDSILEHALIIGQEQKILPEYLPDYAQQAITVFDGSPQTVNGIVKKDIPGEYDEIIEKLHHHGGNRRKTAQALGINRTTLWRKMKRYRLI